MNAMYGSRVLLVLFGFWIAFEGGYHKEKKNFYLIHLLLLTLLLCIFPYLYVCIYFFLNLIFPMKLLYLLSKTFSNYTCKFL